MACMIPLIGRVTLALAVLAILTSDAAAQATAGQAPAQPAAPAQTDTTAQPTAPAQPVAPPAQPAAPAAKPFSFGPGARAADRLAPTPDFAPLTQGLFARQIAEALSADGAYTVQVWSLLVSPKASTGEAKLAGAAVLMLNAGRVDVISADKRVSLTPGGTTSIAEGASVRFVNNNPSQPAHLRAVVIIGSR